MVPVIRITHRGTVTRSLCPRVDTQFPPRVIAAEQRNEAVTEKWDQQGDRHTKRAYSSLIALSLLISRQVGVPRKTIR